MLLLATPSLTQIRLKKETGPVTLSLGAGIHTMTWITHRNQELNWKHKAGITFSTTVGVGLYIISFERRKSKSKPKI